MGRRKGGDTNGKRGQDNSNIRKEEGESCHPSTPTCADQPIQPLPPPSPLHGQACEPPQSTHSTSTTKHRNNNNNNNHGGYTWIYVDPNYVRYQHSRIRPYFSGCGRLVEATLQDIQSGVLNVNDLPSIQVLVLE